MHGDEGDQGTWTFHKTELLGLMSMGGVAPVATPELLGPRNPGQAGVAPSAAKAAAAAMILSNASSFISQKQRLNATLDRRLGPGNVFVSILLSNQGIAELSTTWNQFATGPCDPDE